ncbi:MAG: transcription elongation factor Spt5 [Candidatus Parvarchaeota archaeon]|nr:transcription elongation factor Spt5 [Candidatus Jingweiarchaeum tengchongense]MCW1297755.1 transcription elongation factor Spt5 [Candidatus Jingweiarchaeum tengchongense]MCW1299765.1 transcription elongation factor Spt5 [Candidatus Jingweiarchaeum tengchongense]MCW1304264.1 transcription elongation factor Spt5 [Candidatus Jingweiarchaeum tengchongense]MCW1305292.1 transcription elongation factor Spt5 [Candidatus Jingweiarchaeum tengchongense]
MEEPKIFIVKTTAGRERQVIDKLISVIKRKNLSIFSILSPHGVSGYIFLEAVSRDEVNTAVYGIQHIKGVISSNVEYKEIEHFLVPSSTQITIKENDIVEIISGPFRGEKAKVTRISKTKEEVVVELLEAAVPIPVTVKLDAVKVIRREEEEVKE